MDRPEGGEGKMMHPREELRVTPLDLVLTLDGLILLLVVCSTASQALSPSGEYQYYGVGAAGLGAIAFLRWRSSQHKSAPPPPSSNLLRRIFGLLLMGVGGAITALIAIFVVLAAASAKPSSHPTETDATTVLGLLAGTGIPLLLGNALIYAGAALRAPKPKPGA